MTTALREILAQFAIEFDSKELEKGDGLVDGMVDKLKDFGKIVAGAFAVDAIVGFGRQLIDQADQVGLIAQRLDVSTQALQEWQYAAKLSDIEAGELTASLQRLGGGLAEAASGKGKADTFKKLGVDLKNTDGALKSSIQVFEEAGLAIGALQNPTEAAGFAQELFGKQYARLLPLFREGPEGLAALKQEFKDLGGGFSPEFIAQSQEFNDNLDRLTVGLKGLAKGFVVAVLPAILDFTEQAIGVVKAISKWVKGTKLIQATLTALVGGGVLKLLRALPAVIAYFGGWRALMMRLGLVLLKFIAPLLILEDIIVFLSGGESLIGDVFDAAFGPGTAKNIQKLVAEMVKFFGLFKSEPDNVRKAFATLPEDLEKDLGSFGKFLGGWGQSIVDVGLFAVKSLTGGWDNFVSMAKVAGFGFLLAIKIVWTELKFAGLAAAAALSDAFDGVWNGIIEGAQAALNAMLDVLSKLPGTDDLVKTLKVKVEGLSGAKGAGDAGEQIAQLRDKARLGFAAEYDQIGAKATAPVANGVGTITNTTQVNVTVPPGTPADVARGVGAAAGKGVEKSLRATAALVPTAG